MCYIMIEENIFTFNITDVKCLFYVQAPGVESPQFIYAPDF